MNRLIFMNALRFSLAASAAFALVLACSHDDAAPSPAVAAPSLCDQCTANACATQSTACGASSDCAAIDACVQEYSP